MRNSNIQAVVAFIGAVAAIIIAFVQFQPWKQSGTSGETALTNLPIAGRVVDQLTSAPIRGAEITIAGRTEVYVTEDNGNFRILVKELSKGDAVRMSVSKAGYITSDRSVAPPSENSVILLKRSK